jgi:hypothetical protein
MRQLDKCPDSARHTPCPEGYLQWHEWAEKMLRTHVQVKCPTCGMYAIWKRKRHNRVTSEMRQEAK